MDIEWAKDGITGELFIVQARPETVQSQKSKRHSGNLCTRKEIECPCKRQERRR